MMLWVATVFVAAFALFPNYVGYLIATDTPTETLAADAQTIPVILRVEGMTCDACAAVVREALTKVPGVRRATVSYPDAEAVVSVDGVEGPSTDALVKAVQGAGYKASVP